VRQGHSVDRTPPLAAAVLALDVDGVLLDPGPDGTGSWQSVLAERYGVDPTLLDTAFFRVRWPGIIVGTEAIEPALGEVIAELGWDLTVDELLDCWFENVEVARQHGWTAIHYVKGDGWRTAITRALERAAGRASGTDP
jgi:phosphoglycolate phosphatase-like HAD superfamily hydrolase